MEAIKIFYLHKKDKKRQIVTYSNNEKGKELKLFHQKQVEKFRNISFPYAYAYIRSRNTKYLMSKHINSVYFLKLDIYKFFDSINHQELLKRMYKHMDIDNIKAKELIDSSSIDNIGLAQGLITSPILSNIYLKDFDESIVHKIEDKLIYTRYSDDILVSSKNPFNYDEIISLIESELNKLALKLNKTKIQKQNIEKKNSSIKFLGLNIVNGKDTHYLTVSRKFKKETIKTVSYISKKGKQNYIEYNEKML